MFKSFSLWAQKGRTVVVCLRIAIQNKGWTGLWFTPGLIGGVAVEADQVVGRPGEVVELVLEVLRPGAQVGQQQVTHLRAPEHTPHQLFIIHPRL
jgi:hypothetical protein